MGWARRLRFGRDTTAATHANTPQRVEWECDVERTVAIYHGRPAGSAGRPIIDRYVAGADPDRVEWENVDPIAAETRPAISGSHIEPFERVDAADNHRGPEHWWNVRDAETGVLVETRLYERPDRPATREASMLHAFTLRPFDQWTTQTFPGYKQPGEAGADVPRGRQLAFGLPDRNTDRRPPTPWDALLTVEQSAPSGFGEI